MANNDEQIDKGRTHQAQLRQLLLTCIPSSHNCDAITVA